MDKEWIKRHKIKIMLLFIIISIFIVFVNTFFVDSLISDEQKDIKELEFLKASCNIRMTNVSSIYSNIHVLNPNFVENGSVEHDEVTYRLFESVNAYLYMICKDTGISTVSVENVENEEGELFNAEGESLKKMIQESTDPVFLNNCYGQLLDKAMYGILSFDYQIEEEAEDVNKIKEIKSWFYIAALISQTLGLLTPVLFQEENICKFEKKK